MSDKFTPGPYERTHGNTVYALGTDAEGHCVNRMFLNVNAGWADGVRTTDAECAATAALLAAAPDLYEALRLIEDEADSEVRGRGMLWVVNLAQAALAKAEGRTPPKNAP